MNPYVDIEGSGQTTTIIRGHSGPVVDVAANSELRQVTVEAFGAHIARGIDMSGTNSRLANVTVIAESEDPESIPLGVLVGPNNARPTPTHRSGPRPRHGPKAGVSDHAGPSV